jgi:hypothetical protein
MSSKVKVLFAKYTAAQAGRPTPGYCAKCLDLWWMTGSSDKKNLHEICKVALNAIYL